MKEIFWMNKVLVLAIAFINGNLMTSPFFVAVTFVAAM